MFNIYVIFPFISGVLALWLGFIVLIKNQKSEINQSLFRAILCMVIWLFATVFMFISDTEKWQILWDRIAYAGIVFIPATVYHFGISFTKFKHKRVLLFGYFLSFCFLLLSWTNYFINDIYKYNWGIHSQAKIFHHLFLLYFIVYIFLFFLNIYKYRNESIGSKRKQANYILLAFLILNFGSLAFLPAYGINFPPFSYLFSAICVLILTLAITKHHLFEVKIILTELLIATMGVVLLIVPFLMPTNTLKALMIVIFLLFCIFGNYLLKAMYQKLRQEELLQENIAEKTKQLRERIEELERFYKATINRELKMVELKEKIRELEEKYS